MLDWELDDSTEEEADYDDMYQPSSRLQDSAYRYENVQFDEMTVEDDKSPVEQEKFIVFEGALLQILKSIPKCRCAGSKKVYKRLMGSALLAKIVCQECSETVYWESQPKRRNTYWGNILISAAILFSGSLASKALRVFSFANIKVHCRRTFYYHQKHYLRQAVRTVWKRLQSGLLDGLRGRQLMLGGDARCDSMGHSAKYGTYSLLDIEQNKIVATEMVQSNQVKNSYNMELKGLQLCRDTLGEQDIKAFITDRHPQIAKWVREKWKVPHFYDCWHIVKSVVKKMEIIAKKKGFEIISDWIKSVKNHLYWAVLTSSGDPDEIENRWRATMEHVQGIHKNCTHGRLVGRRKKNYLKRGSAAAVELEEKLTGTRLINDIRKMSTLGQTSGVEHFHMLINQFAPKMFAFAFETMTTRVYLAALHYNENAGRAKATTNDGAARYNVAYPKYKKGSYTVKKILTNCTYDYVADCFEEVMKLAQDKGYREANLLENPTPEIPPSLTSSFENRLPKEEAIAAGHQSRFNKL
ncbi:uncharacterized protein LOC135493502 [Lineus longissimus]|uniref:uncharacterized protein LOC135493502 n=1 Tax=Lineus longissimus TaxID=88925 RepID=UPI00315D8300